MRDDGTLDLIVTKCTLVYIKGTEGTQFAPKHVALAWQSPSTRSRLFWLKPGIHKDCRCQKIYDIARLESSLLIANSGATGCCTRAAECRTTLGPQAVVGGEILELKRKWKLLYSKPLTSKCCNNPCLWRSNVVPPHPPTYVLRPVIDIRGVYLSYGPNIWWACKKILLKFN